MPAKKSAASKKSKLQSLPQLAADNIEEWDLVAKNVFYAAGWLKMWEASNTEGKKDDGATDEDRQSAWGHITESLGMDRLKRVSAVPLGEVELLLRMVRQQFYRDTAGTKNNLKNKMHAAKLEDFESLDAYESALVMIFSRLMKLGYDVSEEDQLYYLLKGLPADYDTPKSSLRLPKTPALSWEQNMSTLREFVDEHPGIVGSLSKHKDSAFSTEEHISNDRSKEVCRDFAKGQCRRGANCRYNHVKPPLHCTKCGKNNHREKDCWSKRHTEETKATAEERQEFTFAADDEEFATVHATGFVAGSILVDGASTCHIAQSDADCFDVVPCSINIRVGGNTLIHCKSTGKRRVQLSNRKPFTMTNVRIVPGFGTDILSEPKLLAAGCTVAKQGRNMQVTTSAGDVLFSIERQPTESLFYLKPLRRSGVDATADAPSKTFAMVEHPVESCETRHETKACETPSETCSLCGTHEISYVARSYADVPELMLQHQRNGHRNFRDVARMYNLKLPAKTIFCRTCVTALSTRFPIGAAATTRSDAPRPGYRFHADTVPLRHATKNGERHILLLVDDYSRAMFLRLLKLLSESVEQLKDFVVRLEAHFGRERVVAQLRTDSASYFSKSIILKNFCNQKGIELTHSPPYTQALNGIAERHVRTVLDVTRALLIEAGAPISLWGFAIKYAVKICNRFFNRASCRPVAIDAAPDPGDDEGGPVHTPSPLELFAGRTLPNQRGKLKVWGCTVYPLSHAENPDKFDPRAEPHAFLGIDDATGGFICGVLAHCNKTLVRAHCVFDESGRPLKDARSNQQGDYRLLPDDDTSPIDRFPHRQPKEPARVDALGSMPGSHRRREDLIATGLPGTHTGCS